MTQLWPQVDECPACHASMRGDPIPKEYAAFYAADATHYSRVIGREIPSLYDGVLYWQCPDCGHDWNRWPPDHRRWRSADGAMKRAKVARAKAARAEIKKVSTS